MRYSAHLFSLATLTVLLFPTLEIAATAAQNPGFFKETGVLHALDISQSPPTEEATTVLLDVEGVLELGDDTLEDGTLVDGYRFEGQAGQTVTIRLTSEEFDPYLVIGIPQEGVLDGNDNISPSNWDAALTVTLPVDGTYFIAVTVSPDTTNARGGYRLIVTEENSGENSYGARQSEGKRLLQQGIEQYQAGQFQSALQSWEQALTIFREIGDRRGESYALNNLGLAYRNLGDPQQAIDLYEQQLIITRDIGDQAGEADVLGNLGVAYESLGNYPQAMNFYEQHLIIARDIGDRAGEGRALGNLGRMHSILGDYQQSIVFFKQAITIHEATNDLTSSGENLGNLGAVYLYLESYQQAINLTNQHLAIARAIGDRPGERRALLNLGVAYENLGQYSQAVEAYEQSLAIAREEGDRGGEMSVLGNLGSIYINLGQYPKAINVLEQSLSIAREIGDYAGEGRAVGNLGIAYDGLGEYQQAINHYQQQLAIYRDDTFRELLPQESLVGEGAALSNLGSAYSSLGQYQQAINLYQQSLIISREIGNRSGEAIALNNQGSAYMRVGQMSQAESSLRQSIEIFESLRTGLSDAQLITIADTQAQAYANLELALIAQNKTAEALAITERGRGRAFVLQLASRLASEEERAALAASPIIQAPTVAEIQQIARDTQTTLITYSLIFDQALYIWVVQPTGEIAFRSVEFEGAGDGGMTVNPIAAIDGPVYRIATPDSELTDLVTSSRASVEVQENPDMLQLRELHGVLIDPISDLLPMDPDAPIVFIPQGELFLVPFAALQAEDGTYLVENHTILTAPSIQVFGLANNSVETRNFAPLHTDNALVVGNPVMPTVWLPTDAGLVETSLGRLAGAEVEALAVGAFLGSPVLTGEAATETRIKQLLPEASLIHLATHGLLEYGIPEASGVLDLPGAIALAPGNGEDGLLTSAEILGMDLQADLAILSACDTGRGRITGDGVVGLSRALISAGVPSVMVSLWAVNDDSTSVLMQRFYEFLATGEFTKAEALRQAQLSLLYDEDVETRLAAVRAGAPPQYREGYEPVGQRHPYHWAPFVLMGNGQ